MHPFLYRHRIFFLISICLFCFYGSRSFAQKIYTIAGNGTASYSGDGKLAIAATLNSPRSIAMDWMGNIYISDENNNVVRKVTTQGVIYTIAGNGTIYSSGDGGFATDAGIFHPSSVACDGLGNVYIADTYYHRVRKIDTDGYITTIAGTGFPGYNGDGGQARDATLYSPIGLSVDNNNNIYIADNGNNRIRKVGTDGIISTVAGNGEASFSGDGGLATSASMNQPVFVCTDKNNTLYFIDYANNRIRKVDQSGTITTIAGTGSAGFSGDGGLAINATINSPWGLAVDANNNVFIADRLNNRIRKIDGNGIIQTVTGTGINNYNGDSINPLTANIYAPSSIIFDGKGDLYIADQGNYRVREVIYTPTITSFSPTTSTTDSTLTIKGSAFTGTTSITIGGTEVKSFSVVNDTTILAVVGDGTSGYVKVTNALGNDSLAGFSYQTHAFMGDSLALVDLYNSTTSINWSKKTNWLTTAPVSTWSGITVTDGRVTSVIMTMNNLYGQIPTSLGNLTALKTLDFGGDKLYGTIPSSLSNLKNLEHLYITANQITGNIPSELGELTNLQDLLLYNNQLTGTIPSTFGNLTSLQNLFLYNNQLTGNIPSSLGNLINLKWLTLDGNQLTGSIPSTIGNITGLQYFAVNGNLLSGTVPTSISGLKNLKYLYLNGDSLTFAGMEGVAQMTVSNNKSYSPQARVRLSQKGNKLLFSVGGTPTNNTFKWYKGSTTNLVATINGDSTFTPTTSGIYFAMATNAVASALTLFSDTISVNVLPIITSFAPIISSTDSTVTIKGTGFTGITSVSFGGVPAKISYTIGDTIIQATVGNGASGYIKITSSNGNDSIGGFIFCMPTSSITNANICFGDSYLFNGTNYSRAGSYVANFTNAIGCDSTATLNLTINQPTTATINKTACGLFTWHGTTYTTSGTYTFDSLNAKGCDSLTTLNLIINQPTTSITNANLCSGASYTFNGSTYTKAGSYLIHLTNAAGCDSVATLILTKKDTTSSLTKDTICQGVSYLFNGNIYTTAGVYKSHLLNIEGCDSIATLMLAVKPSSNSITYDTICQGSSLLFNGSIYSTSGTYIAHLANSIGCDSAAKLILTVKDSSSSITKVSICKGTSYLFNGIVYSNSGTYYSHLSNSIGCDSAAILVLSLKDSSSSVTNASICEGDAYTFNGSNYTNQGIYKSYLTNAVGCDSIAILQLTVNPKITPIIIVSTTSTIINPGKSVTLTSTITNGGISPSYQWYKNNIQVGLNSSIYVDGAIQNGDSIWCVINSTANCTITNKAVSNKVYFNVIYPPLITSFYPKTSSSDSIITIKGTSFSGTNAVTLGGTPVKTFTVLNDTTIKAIVSNGTSGYVKVMNAVGSDSMAGFNFCTPVTPRISITTTSDTVCLGNTVTLTATPINGGTSPAYQWIKGGAAVNGATTKSFTYSPSNNDNIICKLTADNVCQTKDTALSNMVTETVNPIVTPIITIKATNNIVCSGAYITFTANQFNGGNNPNYQWLKNGFIVTGANNSSWTTNNIANSDSVKCILISNANCRLKDSAISNSIIVNKLIASTNTINLSGCNSLVYNEITYLNSTVVKDTVRSTQGCDSIYTIATILITKINPIRKDTILTSCNSIVYNGITYNNTTLVRDTLRSVQGCDSIYRVASILISPIYITTNNIYLSSCNSVVYSGKTYTQSTLVRDTIRSIQGCDSIYNIATITVTNLIPKTSNILLTGCNKVYYQGITYYSSTNLKDTLKSVQGCDSIYRTTTINISQIIPNTKNASVTGCNSVFLNGTLYIKSTIVRDTLKSVQGCDSIYNITTINITPISPTTNTITQSTCGGSIVYNGTTYTKSSIVKDTVKSVQGCDSIYNIVSLNITNQKPTTNSITLSGCNSVVYKSKTYYNSTIVKDTVISWQGCDSIYNIATITVNLITPSNQNITLSSCNSVIYKSKTYTQSTNFKDTTKTIQGCDSVINNVSIVITPITPKTTNSYYSGCNKVFYLGVTYLSSTTVKDTIKSVQGCDSVYHSTVITITPINVVTNSVSLSGCNSVVYKGITYTKTTLLRDSVRSTQGCDSIYNIATISITPITPVLKDTIISSCTSIVYNGKIYVSSTLVRDTIKSVQGCDSIYKSASIIINPLSIVSNNINLSSCNSIVYKGKTYTQSTNFKDTMRSVQGCDSVINNISIVINLITPKTNSSTISGCNKVYYLGVTYLSSFVLSDTIKSVNGCDSIYNITNINIAPVSPKTKDSLVTGCNSVSFNGILYTQSTIIRDTIRTIQGCDSSYNVTTINITQITPIIKYVTKIGCGGSVIYNGISYTNSTLVLDTLKSRQGCDSIYEIVTISILNLKPTTLYSSLSGCSSVNYKGKTYTSSTIVKDTVISTQGCDSIYNIATITITPITPKSNIVPLSGCNSVYYNGVTYTNSKIIIDTLKSWQGCDSIYTIANIVVSKITPIIKDTILTSCNTVVYHGKSYNSTTLVRDTLKSIQGCDSIYTRASIFITPLTVITNNINLSGCSMVVYNGKSYTSSTFFRDTLRSFQGCDSVINIVKISVIPIVPITNNLLLTGCNKIFYLGVYYYSSTVLKDTLKSVQGCDSIYNVTTISVTPISAVTNKVAIFGCDSAVYKGIGYLKSTILRDTLKSVQGCDSVYSITTITISNIAQVTNTISLSGCNNVIYKGIIYTNSTIVKDTVRTSLGCDSIYNVATINIANLTPITRNIILTGCNKIYYKGITYYSSDTLRDTLRSIQGCDSIFNITTINITSITPTTNSIKLTGCNTVTYNGITYNNSTIVRDTTRATAGCDSIYTIATITIKSITTVTNNSTLSGCNSVVYKGITYTDSSIIRDTIRTTQGCDSVYNITTINITKPIVKNIVLANCNHVLYKGVVYTNSAIVKDTIKTNQGCDSIYNVATITITLISPITNSIKLSGCNSIVYNGINYFNSTIVKDTLKSTQGCDSVYTITNITITPITPITKSTLLSGCNSVRYKGITYNISTVVRDTVRSVQGCDSIYNIATITVIPYVSPSINIVANVTNVCQGTNITFTATATDTGFAPTYQWYKNNLAIVGANSLTYSTNSLLNFDSIYCVLTSNATCATNAIDTSNTIVDSIINKINPSITITSDATHACAGTAINFKSTVINGGSNPTYQWLLNGKPVLLGGKDSIFSYLPSNIGDQISCILTSTVPCIAKSIDTSNIIIDSVVSKVVPSITILTNNSNSCLGDTITYTATSVNGGSNPIYQWIVNGNTIIGANNSIYKSDTTHDGDSVSCILTSNAYCTVSPTAKSNYLKDTVTKITVPSISISTNSMTICSGFRVKFNSVISNAGSNYSYQWNRNGIAIKGAVDSTYTTDSLADNDHITCTLITNGKCFIPQKITSNSITETVFPSVMPSITIVPNATTICIGSAISFSTVIKNEGTTPTYKWYKNGLLVDSLNANYSYIVSSSTIDTVYCIINSNASCLIQASMKSNIVYDTATSKMVPSIIITSNTSTVCSSSTVTFTATSVNGGSTPYYQWQKNGVNVGSNNPVYLASGLLDNDSINCVLTSSYSCILSNKVSSNKLGIHILKNVWTGANDNLWNHNSNWCNNVVPNASEDVVIPVISNNNYPTLLADAQVGNLRIDSSATLNINGNTLTLKGDIVGKGNLIGSSTSSIVVNSVSTPTLRFNPATYDSILNSLTINGSGGAILASGVGITKSLNLNAGNLNLNDNHLTLKSTSISNTAIVGPVANGASITGNVTIERFIPAGNVGYRDIGTGGVFNVGSVFDNWQERGNNATSYGTFISGNYIDSLTGIDSAKNANGNIGLYEYVDYNWIPINNTRRVLLDPYLGYQLWIGGNRNSQQLVGYEPMLTTLRTTGQLVTGTITYSSNGVAGVYNSATSKILSFPGNGSFIANPYASPIDWNSLTSSGITKNYYYHDPTITQNGVNYTAFNSLSNTNSNPTASHINRYIQPGQAFWVLNNNIPNATRQLIITENNKVTNQAFTSIFGIGNMINPNRISVSLWKKSANGNIDNMDGAVAVFDNNFSKSIGDEDAKKMLNTGENVSFIEQAGTLCIDGLPIPKNNDTLPLKLTQLKIDTNYILRIDMQDYLTKGFDVAILDKLTNTKAALFSGTNQIYFTPTITSYSNRFNLLFSRIKDTTITSIATDNEKGSITVFPNPVTNRNITVQLKDIADGNYSIVLYDVIGKRVLRKEIINNVGLNKTIDYQINLPAYIKSGLYFLLVENAKGDKIGKTRIVVN